MGCGGSKTKDDVIEGFDDVKMTRDPADEARKVEEAAKLEAEMEAAKKGSVKAPLTADEAADAAEERMKAQRDADERDLEAKAKVKRETVAAEAEAKAKREAEEAAAAKAKAEKEAAEAAAKAQADKEAAEAAAVKAQAAAEQAAAAKVQAMHRGKIDRARIELLRHACDNYRVNMQAETFGDCMCGWPKTAHSKEALDKKKSEKRLPVKRMDSQLLRDKMITKGFCACERYVVNMHSANFGECMCGEAKANHSPEALSAGEVSKATRADSTEVRSKFVRKKKVDCQRYEADINAAAFGMCTCGAPRAEHSEDALKAAATAKPGVAKVGSGDIGTKWSDRDCVDCENFELDMSPGAAFGTCICGAPKAKHSDTAMSGRSGKSPSGKAKTETEAQYKTRIGLEAAAAGGSSRALAKLAKLNAE